MYITPIVTPKLNNYNRNNNVSITPKAENHNNFDNFDSYSKSAANNISFGATAQLPKKINRLRQFFWTNKLSSYINKYLGANNISLNQHGRVFEGKAKISETPLVKFGEKLSRVDRNIKPGTYWTREGNIISCTNIGKKYDIIITYDTAKKVSKIIHNIYDEEGKWLNQKVIENANGNITERVYEAKNNVSFNLANKANIKSSMFTEDVAQSEAAKGSDLGYTIFTQKDNNGNLTYSIRDFLPQNINMELTINIDGKGAKTAKMALYNDLGYNHLDGNSSCLIVDLSDTKLFLNNIENIEDASRPLTEASNFSLGIINKKNRDDFDDSLKQGNITPDINKFLAQYKYKINDLIKQYRLDVPKLKADK